MTAAYLDTPGQWDAAIAACRRAGIFGLDTETFGHDVTETSPAHRAVVHVWSIALRTGVVSARGYQVARGAVLPAAALDYPGWVALLGDATVTKVLHNAGHDAHAIANRGDLSGTRVHLVGWVDTLDAARLVLPGRAGFGGGSGYDLKTLAVEVLGKPPRTTYKQLVGTTRHITKYDWVPCPRCVAEAGETAGAACKLRSRGHGRVKLERQEPRPGPDLKLEEILPGHERWAMLLDYAAEDAVDSLELLSYLDQRQHTVHRPPVPWATVDEMQGAGPRDSK